MKRKMVSFFAATLVLFGVLCTGAMAASGETAGPEVRVNGHTVIFPDGQPYFDENNRTMIPVRFVTEQLGADVSWDGSKQAAIIEKDGIRIEIPLGSATFSVTENGTARTVTMDTVAVAKHQRTYVPIRFVAEALGAYVDYSDAFKVVGIYDDELTAEEIEELIGYDYTMPERATSYEDYKAKNSQEMVEKVYGTLRHTFGNYANAREYLYSGHEKNYIYGNYSFPSLNLAQTNPNPEEFYDAVVRAAKGEVGYSSERVSIELRTDSSCIYQANNKNFLTAAVRGYAVVKINVKHTELTNEEIFRVVQLGFNQLKQGVEMTMPIDIHMNTVIGYPVGIHTSVALDESAGG